MISELLRVVCYHLFYLQVQNVSSEGQQQTSATEQSSAQGNTQQQNQPPQAGGQPPPGGSGAATDKLPPQRYCSLCGKFVTVAL